MCSALRLFVHVCLCVFVYLHCNWACCGCRYWASQSWLNVHLLITVCDKDFDKSAITQQPHTQTIVNRFMARLASPRPIRLSCVFVGTAVK